MDQRNFLLNILELPGSTRIYWMDKDTSNILSSSLCQRIHPSVDYTFLQFLDYCSVFFSRNCEFMPQCSGHEFWHCKTTTIERLSINVYPFSFTKRHIDRRIHNRFRFLFRICHRFLCADEQFNVLCRYFFWRFCDVFVDTIHNANPWNCSVFKRGFNHGINAITSFVKIEFHIQDWADFRIRTNESTLSVGLCSSLEVVCVLNMLSA